MIELRPVTLAVANQAIRDWHSHHKPVKGHMLSVGAYVDGALVGIAVIGRPVNPSLQQHGAFEITRVACKGGVANVGSRLLGACWGAMRAVGVRRLVSYVRVDELGTTYRAAGWHRVTATQAKGWPRVDRWLPGLYEPTSEVVDRVRYEIGPDCECEACRRVRGVIPAE